MIFATMTRERARELVTEVSRHDKPVNAVLLQQAIQTLGNGYDRKRKLPRLRDGERERMNALLCFNLGRALRRAE